MEIQFIILMLASGESLNDRKALDWMSIVWALLRVGSWNLKHLLFPWSIPFLLPPLCIVRWLWFNSAIDFENNWWLIWKWVECRAREGWQSTCHAHYSLQLDPCCHVWCLHMGGLSLITTNPQHHQVSPLLKIKCVSFILVMLSRN